MGDQSNMPSEVAALVEEARREAALMSLPGSTILVAMDRLVAALGYESASVRLHRQAREHAEAALASQASDIDHAQTLLDAINRQLGIDDETPELDAIAALQEKARDLEAAREEAGIATIAARQERELRASCEAALTEGK